MTPVMIFFDVGSSIKNQRQCIVYSAIWCDTSNSGPDFLRENDMKVAAMKSINWDHILVSQPSCSEDD